MFGMRAPELVIILITIAVLFAPRLIKLGDATGRAKEEFCDALDEPDQDRL